MADVLCDECKGTETCACCNECGFYTCQCKFCEVCDEVTYEEPTDDDRLLCYKCGEGCGTCGFGNCQCDAMYDAWRERDL